MAECIYNGVIKMYSERLRHQIEFMLEIEKLKNIYRQTYVLHEERRENDAEHSWHIAVLAFLLAEYSEDKIDVLKTIKMLLIHDIVEIDAGDTYCYDEKGYESKADREEKAAERLFGLLPDDQRKEFYELWHEFEDCKTTESKFAALLDRIQPLLLNYTKDGISWKEHDTHKNQVLKRYEHTSEASQTLTQLAISIINDAADKGLLRTDTM